MFIHVNIRFVLSLHLNMLQLNDSFRSNSMRFEGDQVIWFKPKNLVELLELKKTYPQSKLVGGNTEIGNNQMYSFVKP